MKTKRKSCFQKHYIPLILGLSIIIALTINVSLWVVYGKRLPEDKAQAQLTKHKKGPALAKLFWNQTPGFVNLGNTCFMNSALQALFSLDSFSASIANFPDAKPDTWVKLLQNLMLSFPNYSIVEPTEIVEKMQKDFGLNIGSRQEYATEFLVLLLTKLRNQNNELFTISELVPNSLPDDNNPEEPFDITHLLLRQFDQDRQNEGERRTAPKVFALGVTRDIQRDEEDSFKSMKKVLAPESIDFENGNGIYDLKAVIFHQGRSPNGGHYFSHVKQNGIWFLKNDGTSEKLQSDANPVLSARRNATSTVLFYEKRG